MNLQTILFGVLAIGLVAVVGSMLAGRRDDNGDDADGQTETGPPEPGESTAGGIAASIANGLAVFTRLPLLRHFGYRFWRGMTYLSLRNFHKAHGGDRTALEHFPNGKVKLTPVKWKPVEECGDEEAAGWKVKGRDKTYKPTTLGQTGPRLGKVPILPLDNDTWRGTSILESRVAEAVDLGEMRPLYRVDEAELSATLDARGNAGQLTGGVSADGGVDITNMQFNPRTSPIFEDMIIDLGSDEYDGQAVSFLKVKELMGERTTTDEMEAQEERGFRAGRSKRDMKSFLIKVMLIAGVVALGGLIGPELVAALFGGGGGGGSVIPI